MKGGEKVAALTQLRHDHHGNETELKAETFLYHISFQSVLPFQCVEIF